MPVSLPCRTDGDPNYDMTIPLDGVTYVITVRWNDREASWYLDIADEQAVPILLGLKVLPNVALGAKCRDVRKPPGLLIATSSTDDQSPPGFEELGGRVELIYWPLEEFLAAKS